jgi:hypothetical protein
MQNRVTTEVMIVKIILKFNSVLFMCRINSYEANYRHSTVHIYITT